MKIFRYPEKSTWGEIVARPALETKTLEAAVSQILEAVRVEGDAAVRRFAKQFDRADLTDFAVSENEFTRAEQKISADLKAAILLAKQNIEIFHRAQIEKTEKIETAPGVTCWRESRAIEKVGLYVPGGTAPLFSTVLMLGVPAQIAGCREIVLCTPPNHDGETHPAILFAARACGIEKVFKIGGVQAVAAMAYGTETVPKVYKIFGPGNQYVTAAKQLVAAREGTALDMPAGPSEVAILADETANPAFVAADLLSQAEHGADSQVLLVATDEQIVKDVLAEMVNQLEALPRRDLASQSLTNSRAVVVQNIADAIELLNLYAAEHLILACRDDEVVAQKIENAGSVFLGNYSCESAGDYASGTNHTLPTNGFANVYSGVSLDSFVKKITFQKLSADGIQSIGRAVEAMAEAEGLQAHKHAVTLRLQQLENNAV